MPPYRNALPLLLALGLSSCTAKSSSPKTESPDTSAKTRPDGKGGANVAEIYVFFSKELERLPFDPREERLKQASRQLSEVVGHPLSFRVDVALLPQYTSAFQEQLIRSLEQTAQDLVALKNNEPEAFDWAASSLELIACHYDAAEKQGHSEFSHHKKQLDVFDSADSYTLVSRGMIYGALERAYERMLEDRYGQADPEEIKQAQWSAYFAFLVGSRPYAPRRADLAKPESYVSDPRAHTLLSLLTLESRVRAAGKDEKKLRTRLRNHLISEGSYFTQAYLHHPGLAEKAPSSGTFKEAEAAWTAWLDADVNNLTSKQKHTAFKTVYVRHFNSDIDTYGRYSRVAFPSFDRFAFSRSVIRDWIDAGHPMDLPDEPERALLYQEVVCPHPADETGHRSRGPRCDYDFWDDALSTPAGKKKLFQTLISFHDRLFTESAVINLASRGKPDALLEFLAAAESNKQIWTWALVTAADEFQSSLEPSFIDEGRRWWRNFPERQGTTLYLLSQADFYNHKRVPWEKFAAAYGSSVSPEAYTQFLHHGKNALATLPMVWPALGPGYSRAAPLVSALRAEAKDNGFPRKGVQEVIHLLCRDKGNQDLSVLHDALSSYEREHPSESRVLENLIHDTAPATRCR